MIATTSGSMAMGSGQGRVHHHQVTPRVEIVAHPPEGLVQVLDVDFLIHHHDELGEHQEHEAPEGGDDLAALARVGLHYGHQHHVMEDSLPRHVNVYHLRQHQADKGKEEPLSSLAHVVVLHGRASHQGCLIDGVPPVGDGGQVEDGGVVWQGGEPGVVC